MTSCRQVGSAFILLAASATEGWNYNVSSTTTSHFRRVSQPFDAVPIDVKENVGASSSSDLLQNFPTSVVVPFAEGSHSDPSNLRIREGHPCQIQVIERWVSDGSIRHALVLFQETLAANERKTLHLEAGSSLLPAQPVSVTESSGFVEVNTGKIRFLVSKSTFNLIDELWFDANGNGVYESSEHHIQSDANNGGRFEPRPGAGSTQYDSSRTDVTIKVEESGPLRSIIRVSAPTIYISPTNHVHGFAVRIYAYAGRSLLKIDYQLQNSAKVTRSWPLYFDEMSIDLGLSSGTVSFGGVNGFTHTASSLPAGLRQTLHTAYQVVEGSTTVLSQQGLSYSDIAKGAGWVNLQSGSVGATVVSRNFWQAWPNGLSIDGSGKLSMELFPSWSAQWADNTISPTSLYWLDDMQHVYKEYMIAFHSSSPSSAQLHEFASTVQFPPVASLPREVYQSTRATLDLGGVVPPSVHTPDGDEDTVSPDTHWLKYYDLPDNALFGEDNRQYAANWVNFGSIEPGYRVRPCTSGGFPHVAEKLVISQFSSDYFLHEMYGIGELNVRPQSMAEYDFSVHQPLLELSENPYCGGNWRVFDGHGVSVYAEPPLSGTDAVFPNWGARDDAHGWFYHAATSYFYTGSYWMYDWYTFITQFRRVRLSHGDPFPDMASRGIAHSIAHALQAARITEDTEVIQEFAGFFRTVLLPRRDVLYGSEFNDPDSLGGGFQTGYLMRSIVNYMNFVERIDKQLHAELFNYLAGLCEWNRLWGQFPYYFNQHNTPEGITQGSPSFAGTTIVDPQAWFFWKTGKQELWDHIERFANSAVSGDEFGSYRADRWNGRFYAFVKNDMRTDLSPPSAVTTLGVSRLRGNTVQLEWFSTPESTRYHLIWSEKPIVEDLSLSTSVTNWWAANAVGLDLAASPGQRERVKVDLPVSADVYFALFCFDDQSNMSAMSNVAQIGHVVLTPSLPTNQPHTKPLFPPTNQPQTQLTPSLQTNQPQTQPLFPQTNQPQAQPTIASSGNTIHVYPTDDFATIVMSVQPGDTVIVHEGDHVTRRRISIRVAASQSQPVVISAAAGEARPRILRSSGANPQNTINIEGSRFLTIKGLEIESNGGDGVKIFQGSTANQDIKLEDLVIHNVAVGINVQWSVERLLVHRCHIYETGSSGSGEGMYLGCHDGSCVVSDSIIEGNWVHDTANGSQGDGIELKTNSYGNMIRNNVVYNTNYPCFLLYGSGVGARNIVEGNVAWNCAEGGIQVAADALVQNNLVFSSGYGLLSQPHNGVNPENLEIVHNTFLDASIKCLNVRSWGGQSNIIFSNNAVYCSTDTLDLQGGVVNLQMAGNVFYPGAASFPSGSYVVGRGLNADFENFVSMNGYPTSTSAVRGAGIASVMPPVDFDGIERSAPLDAGAYEWTESGRHWNITAGFKPEAKHPQLLFQPEPEPVGVDRKSSSSMLRTILCGVCTIFELAVWV